MSKYKAKSALRSAKNFTKGYSEIQAKAREATSNDPWGPSGQLMSEIAAATFNETQFIEVMEILDKRLNDSGKNWRHVFKSLIVLDYILHTGSVSVINYAKENMYIVKTLKEFRYIDEEGRDQGASVRQKAKDIIVLISDDERLKEERTNRTRMSERLSQNNLSSKSTSYIEPYSYGGNNPLDPDDTADSLNEERELQRALEESKRTAREHEERMKREKQEEEDLKLALRLSQENLSHYQPHSNNMNPSSLKVESLIEFSTAEEQQQQQQIYSNNNLFNRYGSYNNLNNNQMVLATNNNDPFDRNQPRMLNYHSRTATDPSARPFNYLSNSSSSLGNLNNINNDQQLSLRSNSNSSIQYKNDPFSELAESRNSYNTVQSELNFNNFENINNGFPNETKTNSITSTTENGQVKNPFLSAAQPQVQISIEPLDLIGTGRKTTNNNPFAGNQMTKSSSNTEFAMPTQRSMNELAKLSNASNSNTTDNSRSPSQNPFNQSTYKEQSQPHPANNSFSRSPFI